MHTRFENEKEALVSPLQDVINIQLTWSLAARVLVTVFCLVLLFRFATFTIVEAASITDADGRALVLHGLNICNVSKYEPDYISWHTYDDYRRMKYEWGFNAIRLLIFWAGVEPLPGEYNDAYLDLIEERVSWAESLGMYVILDMHQDLYSAKFTGDGAPLWAVWDDGIPFTPHEPWWNNYLAPAVRRSFSNFWTNTELQSYYINMWVHVASRFASSPTVIGYDLMNEPFFGDFLPWTFESEYLTHFYQSLALAIRSVDAQHWIFCEPEIMTSAGLPSFLGIINDEHIAYFPHYYDPLVHSGASYSGNPQMMWAALSLRDSEAKRAGVPWLMGEFGVAASTGNMDLYLAHQLAMFDYFKAGWTYYSYDMSTDDGFGVIDASKNEQPQLSALVRPYAQKIAGEPIQMTYHPELKFLFLDFLSNPAISAPTELFIGADRFYDDGFSVMCWDPHGTWRWVYDRELDIVKIWVNQATPRHWILIAPR